MRRFPPFPARPHKSGQARIVIDGKTHYLGLHGSPESWAEYQRLLAEWRANGSLDSGLAKSSQSPANPRTVADLVAAYLRHAAQHYTDADGTTRGEFGNIKCALKPLLALHASTPVVDFGPRALGNLLRATAAGSWEGSRGLVSRGHANASRSRWLGVWRWAESEELVPAGTYHALATVRGLQRGQARENEEVPPVSEADFAATLPQLRPVPRAAVELLALTAARPSELLRLTPADIDRSGVVELARGYRVQLAGVWVVQPQRHKTARKGKRRVILFGPQAQSLLLPLLEGREPTKPLFVSEKGRRYTANALRLAVVRACDRAGVGRWCPYRVRHLAATRLTRDFGVELAGAILGHEKAASTVTYALPNLQAAAEALKQVG